MSDKIFSPEETARAWTPWYKAMYRALPSFRPITKPFIQPKLRELETNGVRLQVRTK